MDKIRIIERLLEELDKFCLDLKLKLDSANSFNREYNMILDMHKTLDNSKIDFVNTYCNLSSDNREIFDALIEKICGDHEVSAKIVRQIINLYYLHKGDLIDKKESEPQQLKAEDTLDNFNELIEKYISENTMIPNDEITLDEELLNEAMRIGIVFSEKTQDSIIDDFVSLDHVLKYLDLTEDEALNLLLLINENNIRFYDEIIRERQMQIYEEIERNKADAIDEFDVIAPIDIIKAEDLEEIEKLLRDKKVIEKIVRIINDDYKFMIKIDGSSKEDREVVETSISLAKNDLIERVVDEKVSPYEALERFYADNDHSKEQQLILLHEILDDTELKEYSQEEKAKILSNGRKFYDENQDLILNISTNERELINRYMISLYKDKEQRLLLYKTRSYGDNYQRIIAEATYELKVLGKLLDSIDKDSSEYQELESKVCSRISDILECINKLKKEMIATKTEPFEKKEEPGNIVYLERNSNRTMFEDDVKPDDTNKGISKVYYKDLETLLSSIRNRSDNSQYILPVLDNYKNLKKVGALLAKTSRVEILFIPVGKNDSIIIGATIEEGRSFSLRDQDERVGRYMNEINDLKRRLKDDDERTSIIEKSKKVETRILSSLTDDKKKSLDVMLNDETETDDNNLSNESQFGV